MVWDLDWTYSGPKEIRPSKAREGSINDLGDLGVLGPELPALLVWTNSATALHEKL